MKCICSESVEAFFFFFLHFSNTKLKSAESEVLRLKQPRRLLQLPCGACLACVCMRVRACVPLFYVNEQIHFHAWLVSGQALDKWPRAPVQRAKLKTHHVTLGRDREQRVHRARHVHEAVERNKKSENVYLSRSEDICRKSNSSPWI